MAASWLGGGEGNGKELGLQHVPGRKGPDQHKGSGPGTCASTAGDSNILGVGIYLTQTLFIPNTLRPTVGSREGPVVPVGKNIVALGLLPPMLASSWSQKLWLRSRVWIGAEFTPRS